jgi:hypothetical protein
LLAGIRLQVVDRQRYDPTRTAMAMLAAVAGTGAPLFTADHRHFQRLVAQPLDDELFRTGQWTRMTTGWDAARAAFLERRRPFLLDY